MPGPAYALIFALAAFALGACSGSPAAAAPCRFEAVTIMPVAEGRYAGRYGALEVGLTSDRSGPDVQSFPDSPLALRFRGTGCEVEGGVWQRGGVYVSADGRTVAALESSGSNDSLVFIDSATCRRVGAVDVSDTRWNFAPGEIQAAPAAGPSAPRKHRLDASCRPTPAR